MQADNDTGYKYCPGCKAFHPVECFGIDNRASDGLRSYCKAARRRQKKAASSEPEVTYSIPTDYASRGSVPWQMRQHFDDLIALGGDVWIELPSGERLRWDELD